MDISKQSFIKSTAVSKGWHLEALDGTKSAYTPPLVNLGCSFAFCALVHVGVLLDTAVSLVFNLSIST